MSSWLGPEFRQGAEDPPFWEDEDPGEELSPWYYARPQPPGIEPLVYPSEHAVYEDPDEEQSPSYHLAGRAQSHLGIEPLGDPDPEPAVFADDGLTVDPASLDQTQFSAPSPEA